MDRIADSGRRLQNETRLLFSSLQTHINKIFGQQMPLVDVTLVDGLGRRNTNVSPTLTPQQKQTMTCTAPGCARDADYFANVGGIEQLCCEEHAMILRRERHNDDATSWFCRELIKDKATSIEEGQHCMWFIAWKIPPEMREAFGLLQWVWYPIPDASDGGETNCFNIYRTPDKSIKLPEGARWEVITIAEASKLIGQLIYEGQRGQPPFIVGFAPDEPFDRPDPSLGYSVAKHSCAECTSDMAEPFCFNYKKIADYRDIGRTWDRADVIEYKPELGTIKSLSGPYPPTATATFEAPSNE